MVDEFDAPSRSGRVWPCPLHSHKPCDPRCLSRWDLHRRGEASMSCKHYSVSRLHAVGKSRRSRLSFRWYHLKQTRAGKARSCSKAGPHRNFCWIQRHLRSFTVGKFIGISGTFRSAFIHSFSSFMVHWHSIPCSFIALHPISSQFISLSGGDCHIIHFNYGVKNRFIGMSILIPKKRLRDQFIHFIHSFIQSFIHSIIHSFIH